MILGIIVNIEEELGDFFKFTRVEEMGPLISKIIGVIIVISALLLLIYLMMSGIQLLTSGGEKTAVTAAKERMNAAMIGLLVVLASWAIFTLVKYLFGIPPLPRRGPPPDRVDCCQVIGGAMADPLECCKLVDSVGCVSGRYQADWGDCGSLTIDWDCWARNYPNPSPDPCRAE